MHEVGITKDLVDALKRQVSSYDKDVHVNSVTIRLGKSMEITEESLNFWFTHFSQGTSLYGAKLNVFLVEGNALDVVSLETS